MEKFEELKKLDEIDKAVNNLISISTDACHYLAEQKTMLAKDIAYDLSKAISKLKSTKNLAANK